jgi:hypothetical protein
MPASLEEVRRALPAGLGWLGRWMHAETIEVAPGHQLVRYRIRLGPAHVSLAVAYYDTPGELGLRWEIDEQAAAAREPVWGFYRVTRVGDGVVVSYGTGGRGLVERALGWAIGWRDPPRQLATLRAAVERAIEAHGSTPWPSPPPRTP